MQDGIAALVAEIAAANAHIAKSKVEVTFHEQKDTEYSKYTSEIESELL